MDITPYRKVVSELKTLPACQIDILQHDGTIEFCLAFKYWIELINSNDNWTVEIFTEDHGCYNTILFNDSSIKKGDVIIFLDLTQYLVFDSDLFLEFISVKD